MGGKLWAKLQNSKDYLLTLTYVQTLTYILTVTYVLTLIV